MSRALTIISILGLAALSIAPVIAAPGPQATKQHISQPDRFTTISPGVAQQLGGADGQD